MKTTILALAVGIAFVLHRANRRARDDQWAASHPYLRGLREIETVKGLT
jgi:hypothetical protein